MGLRYNPATGQLEAATTGAPASSGRVVQIVDILGDVKQIPESEVARALSEGAELDSPEKQAERARKAELGSGAGMAEAFARGAARGATLGVSDVVASAAGGAERARELREENPITSLAGEAAGTIGGLFVGPGAAVAKGAAALGERAAAKFAGEGLARAAISKAAQAATRGAVEGAVYGAGQGVSEVALADKPRTMGEIAETVIANAGLGAVLGGAVDVGAAGVAGIGKLGLNRLRALVGGAEGLTGQAAQDVMALKVDLPEGAGSVSDELAGMQATRGMERVGEQVAEGAAPSSVQKAFKEELGITDVPAGFRGGELEGRAFDYLRQRPQTVAGGLAKQKETQILEGVTKRMDAVLGNRGATKTPIARADALSMQVLEDLSAVEKPLSKTFEDLRAATQGQAIPDAITTRLTSQLDDMAAAIGDEGSAATKAIKEWRTRASGVQNIDGLQRVQSELNDEITAAFRAGKGSLGEELVKVRDVVRANQDDALEMLVGPGAQDILREARKGWAEHKATTKEVGELFGFKNVSSTADLERKIADVGPEKLWSRVSKTNDINQLQLLRDKYPHLMQEIRDGIVQDLVEGATKNGQMMAGEMLKKFGPKTWGKQWSEESIRLMFGDAAPNTLRNLQAIYDVRPKLFNPSGTSAAIDFGSFFSPQGIIQELNAASAYAALYGAPMLEKAVKQSDSYIIKSLKSFQEGKGVSGIKAPAISGASQILGKTFTEQADRVAELATQPERVAEMAAKASTSVGRVMPNASGAVTDITMRAMKFLNEKIPKGPAPQGPLDSDQKYQPSPAEKAKWDRYVRAFENPYSVLEDMQRGTITPESVEVLRVVYPELYGKMTSMAIEQLSTGKKAKLSYGQRTALSIFLGQPSDNTMSPSFIAAMQQATRVDEAERSMGAPQAQPRGRKFETNQPQSMLLDSQRILTRGQS